MPKLTIQGVGRVTVGDEFLKLSPYEQQQWVDDFAAHYTEGKAKGVADDIKKGQAVSGETPVKTTLQSAYENLGPSAANVVKGAVNTAVEAGGVLINPDPRAKIDFIKNLAVGTWEGLKKRYGN